TQIARGTSRTSRCISPILFVWRAMARADTVRAGEFFLRGNFRRVESRPASLAPVRRSHADHDVEAGRQLADLRVLDRLEIDLDQLPLERVADAAQHTVVRVLLVAGDEDLGREQLAVALLDLHMDVRGAAGIRHRLDGPEAILALGPGREPAEALEVLVLT